MSFFDWLGFSQATPSLEVGADAPDAAARDERGVSVRLADLYAPDGFTLIYFYPKADTPGCTAQACSLRDDFTALEGEGVRVIGVSSDGPEAQARFKAKHRLPFTLLADEHHEVAKAFGVRLLLGMTNRQAFLIRAGKIVWRDLHAATRDQARDALRAVAELSK